MKIVVIGGTGLIGSKTVQRLRDKGHDVIAASPDSGVNTVTGEGLAEVLKETDVVVDLANSPSFEEKAAIAFFENAGRNLLAAEAAAGVKHHIALSVVGTDRLQASGYFRGKMVQESLIRKSSIPYTIVHSTQFFEFMRAIADSGTTEGAIRMSTAQFQPIAADNVADAMAAVALGAPQNGIVEIAGPDRMSLADGVAKYVQATHDQRKVIADPGALYFGVDINDASLTPGEGVRLGSIRYEDWLSKNAA